MRANQKADQPQGRVEKELHILMSDEEKDQHLLATSLRP